MTATVGMSIWQELVVTDSAGLAKFYSDTLGWTLDLEGNVGTFSSGGAPVAGLSVEPSAPSSLLGWRVYLASDDVAKTGQRVADAGGSVVESDRRVAGQDVPGAVLTDCFGAAFGLLPIGATTVSTPSSEFGRLAMVDVMTYGIDQGLAFFDAVLAAPRTQAEPHLFVYRSDSGSVLFGVNELEAEERKVLPPHWLPWFSVKDSDAALDAAAAAGGNVHVRDQKFVFGKWGVTADPSGAAFKALELHVPGI